MMIATNWGVYEICQRHTQFVATGDDRDMEIRARDRMHLHELRSRFSQVGETLALLDNTADFQYRAFITRDELANMLSGLADEIDYVQFKKDAVTDRLHTLLTRMWSAWLHEYPAGSVYSPRGRKHRRFARR